MSVGIKHIVDGSCYVHALCSAEHVFVIEGILFYGLDNVNAFLAIEYVYLIATVGKHDNEEQDAA